MQTKNKGNQIENAVFSVH